MPNILIKEIDETSAGTPSNYTNYSVLIPGYRGTPSAEKGAMIVEPDANGVYEFSSEQAFIDTIGEAVAEKKDESDVSVECHYGNQMAIELLKLGYPVIYKPIDSVLDLNQSDFWGIFKDRASYDFRFISHGLLRSCDDCDEQILKDRVDAAEANAREFANIMFGVDKKYLNGGASEDEYKQAYDQAPLTDADGTPYSYNIAKQIFKPVDGKIEAVEAAKADLDAHNATHFTGTVFNGINGQIAKLAAYIADSADTGRGDCVALIELDEASYVKSDSTDRPEKLIIDGIAGMPGDVTINGAYCAMTVPSVHYVVDKAQGITKKMPGAFHYLDCFMTARRSGFAEWYATAGYTRGVSSNTVDHTSVKLGEIAINALEPRFIDDDAQTAQAAFACNVIANFRGSYYLWGNRTAAKIGTGEANDLTAKHFLNIRQLCTTIKKQLYVSCRRFTFDPNSDTLWFNFVNSIRPTLDAMKADQGIRDYRIIKVVTDKKATLKAKIRIIPIEAVEDFDLEVSLEDSFGETSATVIG